MLPQERIAWVWLGALTVCLSTYFVAVSTAQPSHDELTMLGKITLLAIALGSMAIIVLVDRVIARLRQPRNEPTMIDERDRLIAQRSVEWAYYVLIAGIIIVGCVMPFTASGWTLAHAALIAIAISEFVYSGLILIGYRNHARG